MVSATALLGASAGSTLAGALLLAAGGMPGGPATLAFAAAPPAPGHVAYNAKAHASQPVVITQASVSPFETVATGDTLSSISAARCGTAADWSGIFYANHPPLRDPDSIAVGQVLRIDCSDPGYTYPKPKIVRTVQQSVQTDSAPASTTAQDAPTVQRQAPVARYGVLTEAQIGVLWLDAGGPAWAEGQAERIAECESGGRTNAYNPSGATGLWQILGSVVGGNLDDPAVNAANAVAKFRASGDTFAQWVCK